MITQDTAAGIWEAYREIEAGKKLLADMEKDRKDNHRHGKDKYEPTLRDVFGRRQRLQLGVPCGDSGHSLYGVSAELGESVIRAHIAEKEAELVRLNEQARIEIEYEVPVAVEPPARDPSDDL